MVGAVAIAKEEKRRVRVCRKLFFSQNRRRGRKPRTSLQKPDKTGDNPTNRKGKPKQKQEPKGQHKNNFSRWGNRSKCQVQGLDSRKSYTKNGANQVESANKGKEQ